MPKTDEKLAAIVAEMRGNEFDDPHLDADGIIGARRLARDWADRIEAAAEREARVREQAAADYALKRVEDIISDRCSNCTERAHGNAAAMRESIETMRRYAMLPQEQLSLSLLQRTIHEKCDAALAAPARNCDRPFRLVEEAIGAYVGERGDGPHLGYCDAIKWALAPAQEGKEARRG